MKKNKNRVWLMIITILIASLLAGCGETVPDLTDEQNRVISEYAVGLLLKHDNKKYSRLVEIPEEDELEEYAPEEWVEPEDETEEETAKNNSENVNSENEKIDNSLENTSSTEFSYDDTTVSHFLGFSGISIDYNHYSVASSYPENNAAVYYACDARDGYKFVILYFDITNNADSEAAVDLTRYRVRYSLTLDGKKYRTSQSTLDPSDISYYKDTLAPGEKKQIACVFEFPVESCDNISLMLLEMKKNNDRATIKLEGTGGLINSNTPDGQADSNEAMNLNSSESEDTVVEGDKNQENDNIGTPSENNLDESGANTENQTLPGYTTNENDEVEVLYYSVN